VTVTVARDERTFVQTLDVLADSLAVDVRAGVQALSLRAFNGMGQPVCPAAQVQSSDASVAVGSSAGGCRILVGPRFPGTTTLTVSADGVRDSVRVRVANHGAAAFFSVRPAVADVFAGNTVSYGVRVVDAAGNPIAGRTVNFDVSAGSLAAVSVATDAQGVATVQWRLPENLQALGRNHTISFRTQLSGGTTTGGSEGVFVDGGPVAGARAYWYDFAAGRWVPIQDGTPVQASIYSYLYVGAYAVDRFGNTTAQGDLTFSVDPASVYLCTTGGYEFSDGFEYTCMYSPSPGNATLTVHAQNGVRRDVPVVFH
jgi:hypothetical protein